MDPGDWLVPALSLFVQPQHIQSICRIADSCLPPVTPEDDSLLWEA